MSQVCAPTLPAKSTVSQSSHSHQTRGRDERGQRKTREARTIPSRIGSESRIPKIRLSMP